MRSGMGKILGKSRWDKCAKFSQFISAVATYNGGYMSCGIVLILFWRFWFYEINACRNGKFV